LTSLGIGAYGVANIPVVQDDAGAGGLFGARGRLGLIGPLVFEPSITYFSNQDTEVDGIPFEAPELTSYAFNLLLKWGGSYATGGIGSSWLEIPGGPEGGYETTYNFGGGYEFPAGPVAVDISPRVFVVETADSASRKNVALMAGVNYYFF
jgi:hypothetical protein